jgi:hypothetical protein
MTRFVLLDQLPGSLRVGGWDLHFDFEGHEAGFGGLINAVEEAGNALRLQEVLDDLPFHGVAHRINGYKFLEVHGAPLG